MRNRIGFRQNWIAPAEKFALVLPSQGQEPSEPPVYYLEDLISTNVSVTNSVFQGVAYDQENGLCFGSGFSNSEEGFLHKFTWGWATHLQSARISEDPALQMLQEAAISDGKGEQHHLGAICFGGGWVWGIIGAVPTITWLCRINPVTLAVDRVWDLYSELGSLHSGGDPVTYVENAGELLYCTPAFMHRISIDGSDEVSFIENKALITSQSSVVPYGFPQGIALRENSNVLLSCYSTGGFVGHTDSWVESRIDGNGKLRPVQNWHENGVGQHIEGIAVISDENGTLTFAHSEGSRVEVYNLEDTPQKVARDYLSARGLVRWYPNEWTGVRMDENASGTGDGALAGSASYSAANVLPGMNGYLDTPSTGDSYLQLDAGPIMPTGADDDWWILVMHRSFDNGGFSGSIASQCGLIGRADSWEADTPSPNCLILRSVSGGVSIRLQDANGVGIDPGLIQGDAHVELTTLGNWHCTLWQYTGGEEKNLRIIDVAPAGTKVTDYEVPEEFEGIVQSGTAFWRIGAASNSGHNQWEGGVGWVGFGSGNLEPEDVEHIYELAGGTI